MEIEQNSATYGEEVQAFTDALQAISQGMEVYLNAYTSEAQEVFPYEEFSTAIKKAQDLHPVICAVLETQSGRRLDYAKNNRNLLELDSFVDLLRRRLRKVEKYNQKGNVVKVRKNWRGAYWGLILSLDEKINHLVECWDNVKGADTEFDKIVALAGRVEPF